MFVSALEIFPISVAVLLWICKGINIRDVAQKTSHLFVFNVLLSDLAPFYSEDSSNSSVMRDCELVEVIFSKIPRFASPKDVLRGPVTWTCNLILLSTSLLLKKCFAAPMRDLAFLILVSIWRSSFSSGVIRLPRYFNLFTKWIFCFRVVGCLQGVYFSNSSWACLRLGGKYIASDLDLTFAVPRFIISPKRAKCLSSSMTACSS